jgi:hypothetical protein
LRLIKYKHEKYIFVHLKANHTPYFNESLHGRHNCSEYCGICGSHGGEYEDGCLQGVCAMSSKFTDVSGVLTASNIRTIIALMMAAVNTPETSANFYQTSGLNKVDEAVFVAKIFDFKDHFTDLTDEANISGF